LEVAFAASAVELEELARTLLEERLEHNVIATVLAAVAAHGGHFPGALFASVTEDGTVIAAALRTPPRQLLATAMDQAVAATLMEAWLERDPAPPGVAAPQPAAGFIAAAFARSSGVSAALHREMAAHRLERVIAPARPASGRLRAAEASERALLIEWTEAFGRDTGMYAGDAEQTVERSLERGLRFIWEDGGEAVSMVGISPPVAGVVRIGPVYTPGSQRGSGYASSAVAAVSLDALERGARACMLFTDLANPTSNKIYAALGYERFGDWAEYGFSGGGGVDHDAAAQPPGQ
jgi:predicted GNAT family acetyltransferase